LTRKVFTSGSPKDVNILALEVDDREMVERPFQEIRPSLASSLIQPGAGWFLNTTDPDCHYLKFINPPPPQHECAKASAEAFELGWPRLVDAFSHFTMQQSKGQALVHTDEWNSIYFYVIV
jgi:hypothetical protein